MGRGGGLLGYRRGGVSTFLSTIINIRIVVLRLELQQLSAVDNRGGTWFHCCAITHTITTSAKGL